MELDKKSTLHVRHEYQALRVGRHHQIEKFERLVAPCKLCLDAVGTGVELFDEKDLVPLAILRGYIFGHHAHFHVPGQGQVTHGIEDLV